MLSEPDPKGRGLLFNLINNIMAKKKVYYVADEITGVMGNRVFFKLRDARKYCYDLVNHYRNEMKSNQFVSDADKGEPIQKEEKYGLGYCSYHGRKAEIDIAYIKL